MSIPSWDNDPRSCAFPLTMDSVGAQRQKIISSVFDKRNAAGSDETYLAHVKIWEEEGQSGGRKARYILLSGRPRKSP